MTTYLFVLGTRPEAIKLCPLILQLKKQATVLVCATGQHNELVAPVFTLFNITPDFNLNLLTPNQTLSSLTARCVEGLTALYKKIKPGCVIVQGDTTSAFCAALSAYYEKIPVAHVEAGLRTHNKYAPFPEEMNRRMISGLADYHFVPTIKNQQLLRNEGVGSEKIFLTGNTGIDALQWILKHNDFESTIPNNKKIILVTGHRRESFGEPFQRICQAIKQIAQQHKNVMIYYPVHLNPNVQRPVHEMLSGLENVQLLPPLGYVDFITLMSKAAVILTDSGGVQEEAPSLRIPVLVMRETTERQEAVEQGFCFLVGTEVKTICAYVSRCLNEERFYQPQGDNPYGDGRAAERITTILFEKLSERAYI